MTIHIDLLRENQIPVEGIFFHSQDGWVKEEQKIIRYGSNFIINPGTLDKLKPLFESSVFTGENTFDHSQKLINEMKRFRQGNAGSYLFNGSFDFLPALFLVLWHSDTIRQVKRY